MGRFSHYLLRTRASPGVNRAQKNHPDTGWQTYQLHQPLEDLMKKLTRLPLSALLAALFLVACAAAAHPPTLPEASIRWPDPQPALWPAERLVRATPNFQAPSATHCARDPFARELPGRPQGQAYDTERRDRLAKSGPAAAARSESALADSASGPRPPATLPSELVQAQPQFQPPPQQVVTAGTVDDNADFAGYLAFRSRTQVQHRQRDIRERYLLEVKDRRGRGVSDAEVAVQAPNGNAIWARTDAAGHVWLHPNAFDSSLSAHYDIAVRKDGRESGVRLVRGQKSAVEVVLDATAAAPRAKLDLVFLIDATGSMADEIGKLKATLRSIAAQLEGLPSRPDLCLGLVAYRDKGDAFLVRSHDFTNDVGRFLKTALNPLQAAGGGDYPEAMNEALHETVHNLSWRGAGATRLVVLLADAPPHLDYGGPWYDDDMMAALGKGIKVLSVGASGLDPQGEFIQRQIAQYTGGRFVFLTYAQAHNPGSGPGRETVHDVSNYSVDTLDRLIVRLVSEELGKLARGG
jgi:Mg-chelatase subunit ChlD